MSFPPPPQFPGYGNAFAPPSGGSGAVPGSTWGNPTGAGPSTGFQSSSFAPPTQSNIFASSSTPSPFAPPAASNPGLNTSQGSFTGGSNGGFGGVNNAFGAHNTGFGGSNAFSGSGFGNTQNAFGAASDFSTAQQRPAAASGYSAAPTSYGNPSQQFGQGGSFGNEIGSLVGGGNPFLAAATSGIANNFLSNASNMGSNMSSLVHTYLGALRPYFAVDNQAVIKAVVKALVPLKNIPLIDRGSPSGADHYGQSPRAIKQGGDLYVPSMALITFTLLASLAKGAHGEFSPEFMGTCLTMCLVCVGVLVCACKFACYLLAVQTKSSYLDILAVVGVIFLHLSVTGMTALLGVSALYWILLLALLGSAAFHTFTALKTTLSGGSDKGRGLDSEWGASGFHASSANNQITIVAGVVTALQVILMWCLAPSCCASGAEGLGDFDDN